MPFDMSFLDLLLGTALLVLIVVAMEAADRRCRTDEGDPGPKASGPDDPALPRPGRIR